MRPGALFRHPNALRIFGPAGAGKTRELVRILREHVDDGDFELHEGIIVSFTRAAAHDIARRVAGDDREPGRYHCTLHALCKRYYGFDGDIADTRLRDFFGERRIQYIPSRSPDPEEWATSPDAQKSEGALIVAFWSMCRNRMVSIDDGLHMFPPAPEIEHWWEPGKMAALWREYEAWKADERLFDFTDMLEYAVANPPAPGQWAFFVLDEAQDSTPLQWAVANVFAAAADVAYIAGDDDQAIYSWAGATPAEFLVADVPADDILRTNHRSGAAIVTAAQEFIRRNRERKDKDMIAARSGGSIGVASDLPILSPDESTFVMARAHYLNEPMMQALTEQGFPFVDKRGKYGVNGTASTAFQRFLRLQKGQPITLDEWRLLLNTVPANREWLVRGAKQRLKEMDAEIRTSTYVRLKDTLLYGATETFVSALQSGSLAPMERLDKERLEYLRSVEAAYGVEFLNEKRAAQVCQVGPVHAFKGLECDHAVINGGMPPAATREAFQDPEPERRVFYVAMTRAREQVTHYHSVPFASQWREIL